MAIETALAKGSLDRVEQRDPYKVYHKITVAELENLSPDFRWTEYFRDTNAPVFSVINVAEPDFVKAIAAEIQIGLAARSQNLSSLAPAPFVRAVPAHRLRR